MHDICVDLSAEHEALDRIVAAIDDAAWDRPTPAPGWSIRDQISHLWYFDGQAMLAVSDPDAFMAKAREITSDAGVDIPLDVGRAVSPSELLAAWRADRARMLELFEGLDDRDRVVWYGPPMAARSFATARLMETWAHGQDVVDTLGVEREATDRLRHVAHIGVRARPFAYFTNDRELPEGEIYVELTGPNGDTWTWGDPEAENRVIGPALDFCLVVTQRRHPDDVDLDVTGALAGEWIGIAQAFAGPPGVGREPGQFSVGGKETFPPTNPPIG